ncbi:MAG: DegV family protein [Bacillota bacterium]|nr:DegV family protein [Bacillota bacterium]
MYVPAGKARSQDKALEQIVRTLKEKVGGRNIKTLAVAHGDALDAANRLKGILENTFGVPASVFTQVGADIAVHTGPGMVGAAVQFE